MRAMKSRVSILVLSMMVAGGAMVLPLMPSGQGRALAFAPPQARGGGRGPATFPGVFLRGVDAHWFASNTKFWYRNELPEGKSEFILVDAKAGSRAAAFDHKKLADALSKVNGAAVTDDKLPMRAIEFVDDGKAVRFTVGGATWRCDLSSYECVKDGGEPVTELPVALPAVAANSDDLIEEEDVLGAPEVGGAGGGGAARGARGGGRGGAAFGGAGGGGAPGAGRGRGGGPANSPDGRWSATIQNNNIVLTQGNANDTPLTTDGTAENSYTFLNFSPDSTSLVAWRMTPGDRKEVYRIQSSPPGQNGATGGGVGRAVPLTSVYALPGDKFDTYELNIFNLATKKQSKPDIGLLDMSPGGTSPTPAIRWRTDGFHFTFEKYDRGHQRLRVIEGNAHSGTTRNIIDEQTKTFLWTAHTDQDIRLLTYLGENEIIYASEIDGWRHYYLIDAKTPADESSAKVPEMKHITKGEWIVRGFDNARDNAHPAVDSQNRVLYFKASGVYPNQDPYLVHYGHINFDGTGLVWMTEGDGTHTITYSPDYQYIIDTYDRADWPGATELRRVSDGKLVCKLETADASHSNWIKPEVFTAKGRDGKTDIWGLFYKPKDFDPSKKYPVIENIYAGPHGSFVPKTFAMHPPRGSHMIGDDLGFDELLLLQGYIIVHVDGMGTANRSRAFHDVCWQNLADAGFPDRILWMKALAAKYPFIDISNVGIFGTSAGGQSTMAALLHHPEFYKVGVANSGCHDNRMDKATWNEQWMGYPVGPQYAASSNVDNAGKLEGRLQLVVGELDTNVPPESTFRVVDALIKAHKDFELVVVPGADHGAILPNETLVQDKLVGFFDHYIKGIDPPNPNAAKK